MPLTVGLNVMFAVQLAPAARLVPHVFEKILKSCGSAPPRLTLLMDMALLPLFVNVATFCPPIPPTLTEAQLRLLGDAVAPNAIAGMPAQANTATATRRHNCAAAGRRFRAFA